MMKVTAMITYIVKRGCVREGVGQVVSCAHRCLPFLRVGVMMARGLTKWYFRSGSGYGIEHSGRGSYWLRRIESHSVNSALSYSFTSFTTSPSHHLLPLLAILRALRMKCLVSLTPDKRTFATSA